MWDEILSFKMNLTKNQNDELESFMKSILGLAIHVAIYHLIDIGVGRGGIGWGVRGPEMPLDFRTNFTQTWLAINVIGSFCVMPDKNLAASILKAIQKSFQKSFRS